MPNRPDPAARSRAGETRSHTLPEGLGDLPWELPRGFLGLDGDGALPDRAGTWVLPVPYEATTSWGGGTSRGPDAIIAASRYIELYDHELDADPSLGGVYTFPALELVRADGAGAMGELETAYRSILETAGHRRLIMVGGEHSISSPAIAVHASREEPRLSVLQLDAHLDLRESFDGSPFSHACAMARVIDRVDLKTADRLGKRPGVRLEETQGTLHYVYSMMCDRAPFDNPDVRLALKHAIDREDLLQKLLYGHGYVGNDHPIGKSNRYYAADLAQRSYDPDKARFHLKKAGLETLTVPLSVAETAFAGATDGAILYQEQAAKAGITIEVARERSSCRSTLPPAPIGRSSRTWNRRGTIGGGSRLAAASRSHSSSRGRAAATKA